MSFPALQESALCIVEVVHTMLYAVIMAGGSGTRLWPLSRRERPKQALELIGERTMFQHAVDRLAPLFPPERIFVVTNAVVAATLKAQGGHGGPAPTNYLIEPSARNSAPAAGLAAIRLLKQDPDAVMVMLTADHYIADTSQFQSALVASARVAAEGDIVTLAIRPTYPATGYGYIRLGLPGAMVDGFQVYGSAGFVEKPDGPTAARFVADGNYAWNSGMFIWRADRLMAEFERQLPHLHDSLIRIQAAMGTLQADGILAEEWAGIRSVSIDYGIMEHADRVSVIPVDLGWTDIGSWASLIDVLPGDENGNVVAGDARLQESGRLRPRGSAPAVYLMGAQRCFVRGDGRLIALIGLEDVIVVDTPDALLVCARSEAERVRELVQRLEAEGRSACL